MVPALTFQSRLGFDLLAIETQLPQGPVQDEHHLPQGEGLTLAHELRVTSFPSAARTARPTQGPGAH